MHGQLSNKEMIGKWTDQLIQQTVDEITGWWANRLMKQPVDETN